jgi:hypothetical protein
MNEHCGRHDRIFNSANPCQGCVNEKAGLFVSSAQANAAREAGALAVKSVAPSNSLADAIEKARSRK